MKLRFDPEVMKRLHGDTRAMQLISDHAVAMAALAAWCISNGRKWFIAVAVRG